MKFVKPRKQVGLIKIIFFAHLNSNDLLKIIGGLYDMNKFVFFVIITSLLSGCASKSLTKNEIDTDPTGSESRPELLFQGPWFVSNKNKNISITAETILGKPYDKPKLFMIGSESLDKLDTSFSIHVDNTTIDPITEGGSIFIEGTSIAISYVKGGEINRGYWRLAAEPDVAFIKTETKIVPRLHQNSMIAFFSEEKTFVVAFSHNGLDGPICRDVSVGLYVDGAEVIGADKKTILYPLNSSVIVKGSRVYATVLANNCAPNFAVTFSTKIQK